MKVLMGLLLCQRYVYGWDYFYLLYRYKINLCFMLTSSFFSTKTGIISLVVNWSCFTHYYRNTSGSLWWYIGQKSVDDIYKLMIQKYLVKTFVKINNILNCLLFAKLVYWYKTIVERVGSSDIWGITALHTVIRQRRTRQIEDCSVYRWCQC